MTFIDNPLHNDNRRYEYNGDLYFRDEFPIINSWIKDGSKVIDLGCGNGALMKYLLEKKKMEIVGIEVSESGVLSGQKQNLSISFGEIDRLDTYKNFKDNEFDYSVCNVTMQMVMYPDIVLQEMMRVSKYQIISFPNFAYFENRFDLLFNGVMPRKMLYGYKWYNTGHIHQFSFKDFKAFCKGNNLEIIDLQYLGGLKSFAKFAPNLLAKIVIALCQKK